MGRLSHLTAERIRGSYRETSSSVSIAALVCDRRLAAFCERALASNATAVVCRECEELCTVLRCVRVDAIMVTACDDSGEPCSPQIGRLTSSWPGLPVIVITSFDADQIRALVSIARHPIADVIIAGHDDALDVARRCVNRALGRPAAMPKSVLEAIPHEVEREVVACLSSGGGAASVAAIAGQLGITRRTLAKRLADAHLPPAGELISWGRLLAAAAALSGSQRSLESVALSLSFGSASALHNITRRYLSLTPTQLRHSDGVELVAFALCSALRQSCRHTAPHAQQDSLVG